MLGQDDVSFSSSRSIPTLAKWITELPFSIREKHGSDSPLDLKKVGFGSKLTFIFLSEMILYLHAIQAYRVCNTSYGEFIPVLATCSSLGRMGKVLTCDHNTVR